MENIKRSPVNDMEGVYIIYYSEKIIIQCARLYMTRWK